MQKKDIIDEVIKSKCRKRSGCCICSRKNTKPYIIPEREILETVYSVTSSFEIFKMLKAFWLCDEHFKLIKEYDDNNCESRELDEVIESSYDVAFLERMEQTLDDMAVIAMQVNKYIRQERSILTNQTP